MVGSQLGTVKECKVNDQLAMEQTSGGYKGGKATAKQKRVPCVCHCVRSCTQVCERTSSGRKVRKDRVLKQAVPLAGAYNHI